QQKGGVSMTLTDPSVHDQSESIRIEHSYPSSPSFPVRLQPATYRYTPPFPPRTSGKSYPPLPHPCASVPHLWLNLLQQNEAIWHSGQAIRVLSFEFALRASASPWFPRKTN